MDSLHIGLPPSNFDGWGSKTIYIHNFLDLPDTKGTNNKVVSPMFRCCSHVWFVKVYPAGRNESKDGMVAVALFNLSSKDVEIDWRVTLMKDDGSEHSEASFREEVTFEAAIGGHTGRLRDFIARSKLIQESSVFLLRGSLVLKLQIRPSRGKYGNRFIPNHPFKNSMAIFLDDETSDVAFDVKGEIIVAHKCIIKAQAKALYEMCETWSKEDPMPINDVNSEVFRIMLSSLYGNFVLPEEWKEHSESILKAAGKWGFDELKLEAEMWYANYLELTADIAINKFLEADGNGWAIIRDAAKAYILEHGEEIVASESFARLNESLPLMQEVMAAVFRKFQT